MSQKQTSFQTTQTLFDYYQDQPVTKFSLTNQNGVRLSVLDFGALVYEITLPNGQNLILNYPHTKDYLANPFYLGMAIGRTAGRIKNGILHLANRTVQLPTNEGTTTLHGGPHGFNSQFWHGQIQTNDAEPKIILQRHQLSQIDGFPGNLQVTITYSLTNTNRININFQAHSDQLSVFNPTMHLYFNLGTTNSILDHTLQINSTQILQLDSQKIPTGQLMPTAQTPFDFQTPHLLNTAIEQLQTTTEKGFDDLFIVQPDADQKIAELTAPNNQCQIQLFSQRNGLVVFSANSFTKEHMNLTRTNGVGMPYLGLALEPETLPNGENEPVEDSILIKPNETKNYQIGYQLIF